MYMSATEKSKINQLAEYFSKHFIVILDDDHKFLMAIDEMEQEFQNRYYDGIVERKTVVRGKFLNKTEQALIKMVYY